MQKRIFLQTLPIFTLLALVAGLFGFSGKPGKKNFETFMHRQDSLVMVAYEKRDVPGCHKLIEEAETEFHALKQNERDKYLWLMASIYYNYACLLSLEKKNHDALNFLEMAVKYGYSNYSHMQADTDLDNIRSLPRYEIIVKQIRAIGDYLYILKNAGPYNNAENMPLPAFTYQSASAPSLTALRLTYKLDSVAGNGTEVSRIINLMHWIHDRVPHNGNLGNPSQRNAADLLQICSAEKRTLNCRGLATVLNEMYLSMGFASRLVTCLPKDSLNNDPDCHVINAVFSVSLNKWLWMDPTNDAYVMDENNNLLSIQEVRSRLIAGLPLKINESANWNHREQTKVENYLYNYMAKNLYMFQCATKSCYDYETAARGKTTSYIQLIPSGFYKFKPGHNSKKLKNKRHHETWFTCNESLFWAAPAK
jgi:hypothetical protein